jgi:hypothetical protein
MRKILALAIFILATAARAALPPQHHNARDLDVMVAFARAHPVVMASLRSIDLRERRVLFGQDCVARFEREPVERPMPGPGPMLRLAGSNCPVGPREP